MFDETLPPGDDRPATSVDVVIFSVRQQDLRVLLVRHAAPPFCGRWAIAGGYLGANEVLDDAARRQLQIATGARGARLEQLQAFVSPAGDPRGRIISVAYLTLVGADVHACAAAAPYEIGWHSIYALPELAFDHADILQCALQRLRQRLEYASAGFELLPSEFTLSELQNAYEIALGEKLDKRNFRRRILEAKILAETERYRAADGQGRPARLYQYHMPPAAPIKVRWLFQ